MHYSCRQSIWAWTRITRLYSKICFIKTTEILLLLLASIDALKDTERSTFRTGVEEHDSDVRINWRFGNCCWRGRRPIAPEIVEVNVVMAENAGRNVLSSSRLYLMFMQCLNIAIEPISHFQETEHKFARNCIVKSK